MGVPTILPDIMASGLQNPKSVILARFFLSSCRRIHTQAADKPYFSVLVLHFNIKVLNPVYI